VFELLGHAPQVNADASVGAGVTATVGDGVVTGVGAGVSAVGAILQYA